MSTQAPIFFQARHRYLSELSRRLQYTVKFGIRPGDKEKDQRPEEGGRAALDRGMIPLFP